ncbi:unnamed protein product [Phytomonas sp. EM1]|nr:unnamed protein product [Phytomonas sp. EM1]|eukprot:CCW62365.1 unnamed protein product [Phytomonas sp. isolate EM1]
MSESRNVRGNLLNILEESEMTTRERVASDGRCFFGPVCIVVCGPSGVGKSTIGKKLAERLCIAYKEGDEYHMDVCIHKMREGIPLNDEDRRPWLERLRREVISANESKGCSVVLACSALKKGYRDILCGRNQRIKADGDSAHDRGSVVPSLSLKPHRIFFVMLIGSMDLIARRLAMRKNHFMPPLLLQSQFSILEPLRLHNDGKADEGAEVGMIIDLNRLRDIDAVVNAIEERIMKNYGILNSSSNFSGMKRNL